MVFGLAGEYLAVEVEVCLAHGIAQTTGSTVHLSPLHHVAVFGNGHRGEELVGSLHEGGLTNHHLLDVLALDALGIHLLLQLQVRIVGDKLTQRHLVVVGDGVTQFGTRLRRLGEGRLHAHDVLHLLLGSAFLEAEELEHADNVALVAFANLLRGLVVLQIVVLLS